MQRFKTRQELTASQGEEKNWNRNMDPWFGLPYDGDPGTGKNPYPELVMNRWVIAPYHLTTAPHPLVGIEFIVYCNSAVESTRVQKKAFAMGYKWRGGRGGIEHEHMPYIHFSPGMFMTYSDDKRYSESRRQPILTMQEFMDGDKPKIISTVPDLEDMLQIEDVIIFEVHGYSHRYHVAGSPGKYFLNRTDGRENKQIFNALGLDKRNFVASIIGYDPGNDGCFPYVPNLPELGKVINALQKLCAEQRDLHNFKKGEMAQPTIGIGGGTSTPVFDLADALSKLARETTAAGAAIHKPSNTIKNGRTIKVQRQAPTIRSGESPRGRRISGRTGKAAIRRRHLGHKTITGRI
jgi:hypothetical protein